jgi:hypothetical protein
MTKYPEATGKENLDLKISLRVLFQEDAKKALLASGEFSAERLEPVTMEIDAQSDELERFLEFTAECEGSWFNPICVFTARELDSANWFQLDCRKTLAENNRDYEQNSAHFEAGEPLQTVPGRQVRILDRIALSRITPLKPNMIAGVDQWTSEFVVGEATAAEFEREGLTGYSLRPVLHSKTQEPQEGIWQLYCDTFMPAVELDRTMPPGDDPETLRELGCLVYDFTGNAHPSADFNRTAEAWTGSGSPLWVVSPAVRECYTSHKLKGWAFRPVLEKGSELHEEYIQTWDALFQRVYSNPLNFF